MRKNLNIDFNEILEEFKSGKKLTGKDGLLAPLIKQLTEAALEAEIESHIEDDVLNGSRMMVLSNLKLREIEMEHLSPS